MPSRIYDGRIARFWGLTLKEYDNLPPDEKAELAAHFAVEREIEGYYEYQKALRYERDSK